MDWYQGSWKKYRKTKDIYLGWWQVYQDSLWCYFSKICWLCFPNLETWDGNNLFSSKNISTSCCCHRLYPWNTTYLVFERSNIQWHNQPFVVNLVVFTSKINLIRFLFLHNSIFVFRLHSLEHGMFLSNYSVICDRYSLLLFLGFQPQNISQIKNTADTLCIYHILHI